MRFLLSFVEVVRLIDYYSCRFLSPHLHARWVDFNMRFLACLLRTLCSTAFVRLECRFLLRIFVVAWQIRNGYQQQAATSQWALNEEFSNTTTIYLQISGCRRFTTYSFITNHYAHSAISWSLFQWFGHFSRFRSISLLACPHRMVTKSQQNLSFIVAFQVNSSVLYGFFNGRFRYQANCVYFSFLDGPLFAVVDVPHPKKK